TVAVEPNHVGSKRDALLDGVERQGEFTGHDQQVSQRAGLLGAQSQRVLPSDLARVGLGHALGDGEHIAVGLERGIELVPAFKHVSSLGLALKEVTLPGGVGGSAAASRCSSASAAW